MASATMMTSMQEVMARTAMLVWLTLMLCCVTML